jgi:hypothetical protein
MDPDQVNAINANAPPPDEGPNAGLGFAPPVGL